MKEMIKRKDGSYSQRGLWDNIRANRGSGKAPTKEMLEQERKIRAKAAYGMEVPDMNIGGYFPRFMQDGGEPDGPMALSQMAAVIDKLSKLRQFINEDSDLEPWVSSKLAVMDHYADAVSDYMMYGAEGEEDEEEEDMDLSEQEMEEMKNGGIPERYRKRGFTKVGVKRKSTRPGKKWMVLAKKGDKYKIVHGGYKGMQDYTQHHSKQRQKNFWNRMGGKSSSKATDPFSPLYWHKRFGTWEDGGEVYMMQDGGSFGSAFAAARRAGKDVFTWNGKSYTTETKEEQDNKTKQKDMIPPSKRPTPTPFVKRAIAPQTKEVVVDKRNMFERFFNMSEDEVKRFNLPLDVYDAYEKQKEGNKGKNFGIVSKKNARAYFFDPEGRLAVEDEVGIGKDRGDEQPIYYQVMTTPSGTYNMYRAKVAAQVADRMKKGYDADNFFYMDNQDVNKRLIHPEKGKTAKQAMHGIPKHLLSERSKAFGNETLDDNYMSAGCINCKRPFLDNPYFNSFNQGQVYVLPEKKSGGMPCYECGGQYQNGGHYNLEGEWVKSKGSGTFSGNAYYKDGGNSTDEYINNTLNSNQMNPLYHFIKRAQMGGEQQSQDGQVMQLIQAYAQMQGVDPQQIMAQLQQMTGPEQQQAVQQMMEAVQSQDQETINFTNPMMAYGGEMGGPVILPSLPVDVYGMPMYGGGGAAAYLNPYTDAMMEMQDGGKPEWLIRAQLKAQGYTGSALENKLSQMKQGGIHINPANKGKFTAKAKAAGMGVQAFASKVLGAPEGKYSPATRKQANFAKNASKWKKQLGGLAEGSVLNNVDQDTIDELTRLGYQFEIM